MKTVAALSIAAALAACGEPKHEPVKVIAAPRPAPAEAMPPSPPPAPSPVQSPSPTVAAAAVATASAPAKAAPEPVRPGFIDRSNAPPFVRPGDPTGNDAFRRAVAERAASASAR